MDTHAVHPHVLVRESAEAGRLGKARATGVQRCLALRHRVQMAVEAFQTDVEVLRDVPLSARRDAVVAPVERTRTAV